jgi:hypothetical protein
MSEAERVANMTSVSSLVWNGARVNGQLGQLTGGVSTGGHLKIYAPATYDSGSTGSHWDTSSQWSVGGALHSLLMEPFITANPSGVTDFTGCALQDMGWTGTRCPDSTGVPAGIPPVASAQSVTTTAGIALTVTLSGSSADGLALSYEVVTNPVSGTLGGVAPALVYTPNAGFSGSDSFTFRVNDGALNSANATVSITVSAPATTPAPAASASNGGGGGGGGGGGSMGGFGLLLLATSALFRRGVPRWCVAR